MTTDSLTSLTKCRGRSSGSEFSVADLSRTVCRATILLAFHTSSSRSQWIVCQFTMWHLWNCAVAWNPCSLISRLGSVSRLPLSLEPPPLFGVSPTLVLTLAPIYSQSLMVSSSPPAPCPVKESCHFWTPVGVSKIITPKRCILGGLKTPRVGLAKIKPGSWKGWRWQYRSEHTLWSRCWEKKKPEHRIQEF